MSAPIAACPRGSRCESCGREHDTLTVAEVDMPAGLVCLTLCPGCAVGVAGGCEPPITAWTASRLAEQHRDHLALPRAWSASGP